MSLNFLLAQGTLFLLLSYIVSPRYEDLCLVLLCLVILYCLLFLGGLLFSEGKWKSTESGGGGR